MGLSYTGSSCLLVTMVRGYRRVLAPPAKTIPFMKWLLPYVPPAALVPWAIRCKNAARSAVPAAGASCNRHRYGAVSGHIRREWGTLHPQREHTAFFQVLPQEHDVPVGIPNGAAHIAALLIVLLPGPGLDAVDVMGASVEPGPGKAASSGGCEASPAAGGELGRRRSS